MNDYIYRQTDKWTDLKQHTHTSFDLGALKEMVNLLSHLTSSPEVNHPQYSKQQTHFLVILFFFLLDGLFS